MVRSLKRKFIFTTMLAVLILLLTTLVVLGSINYAALNKDTDMLLDALYETFYLDWEEPYLEVLESEEDPGSSYSPAPESDGDSDIYQEPGLSNDIRKILSLSNQERMYVNENDILRSAFFSVKIDSSGSAVFTDVSHVSNLTPEDANQSALLRYQENSKKGWDGSYRYKAFAEPDQNTMLLFLYHGPELSGFWQGFLFLVLVLAGCFGVLLILVIVLSNILIKPVALNIERQKDFVTFAGHEIKTPLAIIQTNTEALELHTGENKWTSNIKDQTMRLSVLMSNMLTLARAEEETEKKTAAKINLSSLLREFLEMFKEPAAKKQLEINSSIEDDLLIRGDRTQIAQVISIVMDNAVKYSSDGTTIQIRTENKDKQVLLEISNYTDMLPDCEPERLFERFYRPDSSRYRVSSGNGIGLAAARAILKIYGGSISCRYASEKKIVFSIFLKK